MRVILHIGVHKTGTSALQSFLHRNAALLSDRGVFYKPTSTAWPNHNPLAAAFLRDSEDYGPDRLAKTLEEAGERTLLISSEMLCDHNIDLDLFLSLLEGHDVRTIAYIRHPSDIIISAFNEVVRHYDRHWTRPLNERPFAYDPSQIDILRRWLKVPNLTLAPYDHAQWVGGSIFSDFLAMIGVADDGFDYSQTGGNESLPYPLVEALRLVNTANPSADQHRALVETLLTIKSEPGEYPLTRENVTICINQMRQTLPHYRQHLRPGFQEAFLLEPRPARGVPYATGAKVSVKFTRAVKSFAQGAARMFQRSADIQ
ncbi:hypothetical protein NKH57_31050 [Mesorhizobium sp. M1050]|uniref:hypothetical protein n=1 Tax=Mesorhizobium sp. M1050 TaxID=2957051 RepID=UPI00333A86C9